MGSSDRLTDRNHRINTGDEEPSVVILTYNPSTQEVGGSGTRSQICE